MDEYDDFKKKDDQRGKKKESSGVLTGKWRWGVCITTITSGTMIFFTTGVLNKTSTI